MHTYAHSTHRAIHKYAPIPHSQASIHIIPSHTQVCTHMYPSHIQACMYLYPSHALTRMSAYMPHIRKHAAYTCVSCTCVYTCTCTWCIAHSCVSGYTRVISMHICKQVTHAPTHAQYIHALEEDTCPHAHTYHICIQYRHIHIHTGLTKSHRPYAHFLL